MGGVDCDGGIYVTCFGILMGLSREMLSLVSSFGVMFPLLPLLLSFERDILLPFACSNSGKDRIDFNI